jgi:hypothetical protein
MDVDVIAVATYCMVSCEQDALTIYFFSSPNTFFFRRLLLSYIFSTHLNISNILMGLGARPRTSFLDPSLALS